MRLIISQCQKIKNALKRAHIFAYRRSGSYYYICQRPLAYRLTWLALFLVIFIAFGSVIFTGKSNLRKGILGAQTQQVTDRENWEAGTITNLDTEDTPGDIKVAAEGSWTARTWKTPPYSLTLGVAMVSDGTNLYVLRGNGDKAFWKYNPVTNDWTVLSDAPFGVYQGSHLEMGPSDTIYAVFGNYIKKFYKYTISTNAWTELAEAPDTVGTGSTMAYNGTYLFLLRSSATQDFWKYDPVGNSWSTLTGPPATVSTGSDLLYDGSTYFYTLRGGGTNTFYRYSITGNSWATMTTNYPTTLNEATHSVYYAGAIYIMHGVATTTFYKCTINALTCTEGAAWGVMTAFPAATRYAGLVYNSSDGYLYAFRGNGTYDLWKYNIAGNSFVGPTAPVVVTGTGGDLIWDGGNYVYMLGGNNTNSFYYYNITTNVWAIRTSTGLGALNYDTKAIKAGNYLYVFQGNNTNFYRYDTTNDAGGWSAMTGPPASIINGGGLAYPGSGDYIYALRGAGTNTFYAYSIANNNWTTFDPTDLPSGANMNIGGRIVSDGTYVYALLGIGSSRFYRYTYAAGGGSWTAMTRAPFAPYYGSDLTYYNGKIYATAGYYKNKFYEYNISGNSWRKLANIQTQYLYDIGPYNGASIEYMGSNSLLLTRGAGYADVLSYTLGSNNYQVSGTYQSQNIDLTYVASWTSLTKNQTTPGDSSVSIETRTSANGTDWSAWQALSGNNIQSPVNRYI